MIDGWREEHQWRTAATALLDVVIINRVCEGCHTICLTGCSWTSIETRAVVCPSSQIHTMFGRFWSTVVRILPLELNAMRETPRGGPDGSVMTLNACTPAHSPYSRLPSLAYRSLQTVGACWSIWKLCEREVEHENWKLCSQIYCPLII